MDEPKKPKKNSRVERLIFFAVALIISPMLVYTCYLTSLSLDEGNIYKNAPDINAPGTVKEYGVFYQARGQLSGKFLNPESYPEVKNGLQTKITREVFDKETNQWKMADKTALWERVSDLEVGGQPVKVAVASRLVIDTETETLQRSESERAIIEQQKALPVDYVVFGMYVNGVLQDGHHERLVLAPLSEIDSVLALIKDSGKKKAVVLAILSGVFVLLIGITLRAAVSGPKKAACC